jgi:hypothetical protein
VTQSINSTHTKNQINSKPHKKTSRAKEKQKNKNHISCKRRKSDGKKQSRKKGSYEKKLSPSS